MFCPNPLVPCSGRQGHNPAGESCRANYPIHARSDATVRAGNRSSIAWCKRPGCPGGTTPYSGRCNRGALRVWEPEHKGMTAASKTDSLLKLHCRDTPTSRTRWDLREADAPREETGRCTGREWRGTGPSTYTRIVEITSGGTILQQGLAATCKDLPSKGNPKSAGGIWCGA